MKAYTLFWFFIIFTGFFLGKRRIYTYSLNSSEKLLRARAGLKCDNIPELRLHNIGLIFQFFNLITSLTVLENIELPLALARVKKPKRKERASQLIAYFELNHLAESYPENLIGGERQRTAVIRAARATFVKLQRQIRSPLERWTFRATVDSSILCSASRPGTE